jgi:hypothetical protein
LHAFRHAHAGRFHVQRQVEHLDSELLKLPHSGQFCWNNFRGWWEFYNRQGAIFIPIRKNWLSHRLCRY